ncbi:MAG: hypothetical protein ACM3O5_12635 [Betaproteobacteria bacterium]
MSSPTRPLSEALRDAPEAARLLARWETSRRIALCIAPVCRSLASGFDPLLPGRCELRDNALLLTASSTAQSAKLRQVTPRLLSTLGGEGIQVYEIRVRVQPGFTGYPEQGSGTPSSEDAGWLHPAPSAGETMAKLALTVRESPLKHAVARLAATLGRRARR